MSEAELRKERDAALQRLDELEAAVRLAVQRLSRFGFKGPKQIARVLAGLREVLPEYLDPDTQDRLLNAVAAHDLAEARRLLGVEPKPESGD